MLHCPPMSSQPCRNRNREALISSVYHNTPLFRGLVNALDHGLNRHNPCTCPFCLTQTKRPSSTHLDVPPAKRARSRPSSYPTPATKIHSASIYYCRWCSFPDHSSRLSCRECGRRRAPPAMAQHFRDAGTLVPNPSLHRITSEHRPTTYINPDPVSSLCEDSQEEPRTPITEEYTDLSSSCHLPYSPNYPSPPLPGVHESEPVHNYVSSEQSPDLNYHSPQSTVPDPAEFADYESIGTPESRSMASKSMTRFEKTEYHVVNGHPNRNDEEINVASLIEDVSKEVDEDANSLRAVANERFSLMSSTLSEVTSESVVELGGVDNDSKDIEDHKDLPDQHDADIFLCEMIMSGEEKETETCNELSDLPLTFLDGIFPSLSEQDAY